jgi:2-polyprenyl-3-methyl-5-hydroxy-6-metoxy-1,4-benzoquinol methylase
MPPARSEDTIRSVVESYDSRIIRVYSRLRFLILRQSFLEEIEQYPPATGRVLDLGCGFGLFSLYFAARAPQLQFHGLDANAKRIGYARTSASRLGITNAEYEARNVLEWEDDRCYDCIYLLDLLHHLPRAVVPSFVARLSKHLTPGGTLVLKEVEDRPLLKRWFTLALDRLMVGMEEIHYWPQEELIALLEEQGLQVHRHRMKDFLPYPHILYVARPA